MKKVVMLYLVVGAMALAMSFSSMSCSKVSKIAGPQESEIVAQNDTTSAIQRPGATQFATEPYTGDATGWVLSETRYTLDVSRNGRSNVVYNGYYMADWDWATGGSDPTALKNVSADYGGATGTLGWNKYFQGGWCKFFVSLSLYRCSYGLGNGYHLVLPSGYTYATTDVASAGPGWVLQSTMPHTAVIDSPHYNANGVQDGWWLIDANWIGTTSWKDAKGVKHYNYSYWIGKHSMTFADLRSYGFHAWKPNLKKKYV